MESILFLITGLVIGSVAAWLIVKYRFAGKMGIPQEEIDARYISREIYNEVKATLDRKENDLLEVSKALARTEEENSNLQRRLAEQREEIEKIQQAFKTEFENLSNKILEEKSRKFLELNEKNLSDLLKPLKEKIQEFEKKVEETHKEEIREKSALKTELRQIIELNLKLSEDATRLTNALKGDKKIQGDWGELQLETILQKAGLQEKIHYVKQTNFKDDSGKNLRPDFIINLPDDKHLILDSKVSLTAYAKYYNSDNDKEKAVFLKQHLDSIKNHINELGNKNYQTLYEINTPDYVLMFVPIDHALTIAIEEDRELFSKALEKNIVLVTTSTLFATLRTIAYIWKQENQNKNAREIAYESGKLYDKFVAFVDDLEEVGKKLDGAKNSFDSAMNKLTKSTRKGDTIIGRIERIKKLGANSTKSLPDRLLDQAEYFDNSEGVNEPDTPALEENNGKHANNGESNA